MIEYREFGAEYIADVLRIYEEAGWRAYLGNDDMLIRAFGNSLCVIGAFEEGRLMGLIRCVGDGEHIVYVQDLIVEKASRRRGIGRELMHRALERYCHVRMFALITDANDETANAFYRGMGMKPYERYDLAGYCR